MAATAPLVSASPQGKHIPVGLELYSVRDELAKDLKGTVTAVAKMGYEVVEFFSPYYSWTTSQASDMRKLLDDLGIRCLSTHNSAGNFQPENLQKAIDLNKTIGNALCRSCRAKLPENMRIALERIPSKDAWTVSRAVEPSSIPARHARERPLAGVRVTSEGALLPASPRARVTRTPEARPRA